MKRLAVVLMLAAGGCGMTIGPGPMSGPYVPAVPGAPGGASAAASGEACYFKNEQPAGMNKICFYNCIGSLATIAHNVSSAALCPMSISR